MNRLQFVALLWACLMLMGRLSQAQQTVVVVVPRSGLADYDPFEHRLRSELIAAGYQPISLEVQIEVDAQTLKKSATQISSSAAISIAIRDGSVSGMVWLKGRESNPDSLRPIPPSPIAEHAPSVFAVRATDILHGGLLELGYVSPSATSAPAEAQRPATPPDNRSTASPAQPPKPANSATAEPTKPPAAPPVEVQPKPLPEEAPPPPPKKPRVFGPTPASKDWRISAMGTIGAHLVKDAPTSYGLSVVAMRRLFTDVGVGLRGIYFFDVQGRTDSHPGDTASVNESMLGARFEYLQRPTEDISLFEYAETGVHRIASSGTPKTNTADGYLGYSVTGYSGAGIGAIWWQGENLGIVLGSGLLYPWRPTDVLIFDRAVVRAAQPTLLFNLGLELAL